MERRWYNPVSWFKKSDQTPFKRAFYAGADVGRLYLDWVAELKSIDAEIKADSQRLRGRARDLAKNNPYIRQYLNLLISNVIGPNGIKLQGQIRNNNGALNKAFNDRIEWAWNDWAKNPSIDGKMSLHKIMVLSLKTTAIDGEIFIRKVKGYGDYGFSLQLIDSDLVDWDYNVARTRNGNEIRMGIEVDEWGRPVAYHIFDRYPVDTVPGGLGRERKRIPASEIIHIYDPERLNQTRGVTWFNSVMLSLKMLAGYTEAELTAARISSAKMGFLKYTESAAYDKDENPVNIDATPGSIEILPPGLDFQEWSPDHPASAFPSFIKAILREISTGLGVSYNALANDLEGVNYSSIRSGLLIERDLWKVMQNWWIDVFLDKIYREWIGQALLTGALVLDTRDPRKFLSVRWMPRGWQWVDPLKDVNAAVTAIEKGLSSRTEVLAEKGRDYEDVAEELSQEQLITEEYGIELVSENSKPSDSKKNSDSEEEDTAEDDQEDEKEKGQAA